ncbi:hypothetical protein [Roseovarius salis]
MEQITGGYRGLGVLLTVNWDRLIYLATIVLALLAGAYIGSL